MRDGILAGALILSLALWVTAHVTLVAGISARIGPLRALVALVALPLAPVWGCGHRMRARAALWGASATTYVVLRWLAER